MAKNEIQIRYRFTLADGSTTEFNLVMDVDEMELVGNVPADLPEWTELTYHQCPNCPLKPATHPHCPLAANLVSLAQRFEGVRSYDRVFLTVVTDERTVFQDTSAQKALGSLMGLIIPTSGCPNTAYFRPMARYHLPLASTEETLYRAMSMYLLAQYFRHQAGQSVDLELEGLTHIYENMMVVNMAVARRLRAATESDSSLNAIVILDTFAQTMPLAINGSPGDLLTPFLPYLAESGIPNPNTSESDGD